MAIIHVLNLRLAPTLARAAPPTLSLQRRCHSTILALGNAFFLRGSPLLCAISTNQSQSSNKLYLLAISQLSQTPVRLFGNTSDAKRPQDQGYREQAGPILLYTGPFASLTLKLKRISLTSAVIGIVGLPLLSFFYGSGTVPATGQLAVIATAGVTAVGSTALLGYCFSPYVHTLERLPAISSSSSSNCEQKQSGESTKDCLNSNENQNLVRITTRDVFTRKVETIFDPATDVSPPPPSGSRPFCNFMVKGLPLYVHPELVNDRLLRIQLVGEPPVEGETL